MTTEEKLSQLQFLVKKALVTIENEKQDLFNSESDYLSQRNELEHKLLKIYEMFFEGETYSFHAISQTQYEELIEVLKSLTKGE